MTASPVRRVGAPTPRAALAISGAVLIGLILLLGADALPPFVVGLLLVYLLDPGVSWLARRGLPRWSGILILYGVVLAIIVAAVALLLQPLAHQLEAFIKALPGYSQRLQDLAQQLTQIYEQLNLPPALRDLIDRAVANLVANGGKLDLSGLLPIAGSLAAQVARLVAYLVVPVWAFFLLKDRDRLLESLGRSVPDAWRADTWAILAIIERTFGRWIRGQLILGLTVGLATFAGLIVLGVLVDPVFTSFAVFLAVFAGILELVPIIGPVISMVPTLLIALTTGRWEAVIAVLLLYILVQQAENHFLVPVVQSGAIDLHPSIIIFALIMGGAIAGLLGAILALPITAAGRDIYRYLFRRTDTPPLSPEEASASLLPRGHGPMVRAAAQAAASAPASPGPEPMTAAPRPPEPPSTGTASPETSTTAAPPAAGDAR